MTQWSPLREMQSTNPYDCNMGDARPVFADLIADARRAKGMSQEDLEAASGVSRGTLSRWERGVGDRPEPENVRAVCAVLGIDPRWAAVSLGYLTAAEVEGPGLLRPEVEQVLAMLEDPTLPAEDRDKWIDYLKFLYARAQEKAS
jgi:transcriptional regulator with XRE-family HTH domain